MDQRWSEPDREAVGLFEERFGAQGRLEDVLRCFARLPYENLSKILAWDGGQAPPRPRLPRQVMREHLELGTGGTCFSLTELLRQLVRARGLAASPLMAHMRHGANIHCALGVERAGRRFLVDPGYLVPEPLPLRAADPEAPWSVGQARLIRVGALPGPPVHLPDGELDLYTMEPEGPRWRYRVDQCPPTPARFRRLWLESFHQPAMRSLLVTQRDAGRRLYLHDHKLRVIGPQGKVNHNVRATLEETLADLFGIDPRVSSAARSALRRQRGDGHGP